MEVVVSSGKVDEVLEGVELWKEAEAWMAEVAEKVPGEGFVA